MTVINEINQFLSRAEVGTALIIIAFVLVFFIVPRLFKK